MKEIELEIREGQRSGCLIRDPGLRQSKFKASEVPRSARERITTNQRTRLAVVVVGVVAVVGCSALPRFGPLKLTCKRVETDHPFCL